jgi:hypothetical protein
LESVGFCESVMEMRIRVERDGKRSRDVSMRFG